MVPSDLRIAQYEGSTKLGGSLPEKGNRASFRNVMPLKKIRHWTKSHKRRLCELTLVVLCSLFTHHDMAVYALIWLHVVQFSASYANSRRPHIFKHQIQAKNFALHLSKYSITNSI